MSQANHEPARTSAMLVAVMCFAVGVLVMDVVRDYRDKSALQAAARERVFLAAQDACTPDPGQQTVQKWSGDHITCVVYEDREQGRVPRVVRALKFPAIASLRGAEVTP